MRQAVAVERDGVLAVAVVEMDFRIREKPFHDLARAAQFHVAAIGGVDVGERPDRRTLAAPGIHVLVEPVAAVKEVEVDAHRVGPLDGRDVEGLAAPASGAALRRVPRPVW